MADNLIHVIPGEPCHDVHAMRTMIRNLALRLTEHEQSLLAQGAMEWVHELRTASSELRQVYEEVPPMYKVWRHPKVQMILRKGLSSIRSMIQTSYRNNSLQQGYQPLGASYHNANGTPYGAAPSYPPSNGPAHANASESHGSTAYSYTASVDTAQAPSDGTSQSWQFTAYTSHVPFYPSTSAPIHHTQPPSTYYPPASVPPTAPYGNMAADNTQWPMSPRSGARHLPPALLTSSGSDQQYGPSPMHVYTANGGQYTPSTPRSSSAYIPPVPEQNIQQQHTYAHYTSPQNPASYAEHPPSAPYPSHISSAYAPPPVPPPASTPRAYVTENDRRTPTTSVPDVDRAVDVAARLIDRVRRAVELITQLGGL